MLNLIYLAYAFARSAALWIILFTSTATIALLYSSLPRRSEEGLQSSDANCAACAMADSVSSLPKRACSDRDARNGVGLTLVSPMPMDVQTLFLSRVR